MLTTIFLKKTVLGLALIIIFYVSQGLNDESPDTSLYDYVAMAYLEDYVDVLEMISWFGRRVRDNIDENVESAFELLAKQQDNLDPHVELARKLNKTDCTEKPMMSIGDIVFKEYFNINLNCHKVGQKMAVFLNELNNITTRVTDIHTRYIHAAHTCGPPILLKPDRECLQRLIQGGKAEILRIKNHMYQLSLEIEEFMDGQQEETFVCLIESMSQVRNATKRAAHDIECCIADDYTMEYGKNSFMFPKQHPYLELPKEEDRFAGLVFLEEEIPMKPPLVPDQNQAQIQPHPAQGWSPHPGAFQGPHPVQNPQPYPQGHNQMYPGVHPPPTHTHQSPFAPAQQQHFHPPQEDPPWRKNTRDNKDYIQKHKAEHTDFQFSENDENYDQDERDIPENADYGDFLAELGKIADALEDQFGKVEDLEADKKT